MANHTFIDYSLSLHKRLVNLYAVVNIGATGAPTFQKWDPVARSYSAAAATGWKGVKSIVRVSAGLYTITLLQPYNVFLGAGVTFQQATASAAPLTIWPTPNANLNSASAPTIQIQFLNTSGVATDPASGEQIVINLNLADSTSI